MTGSLDQIDSMIITELLAIREHVNRSRQRLGLPRRNYDLPQPRKQKEDQ